MSERIQYRPKRHIRHEIYSLAAVMLPPVILAFVFPYAAVLFRPSQVTQMQTSSCAFVSLSDEETDAAIAAARSAIKTSSENSRRLLADLSLSSIPEELSIAVADISQRTGIGSPACAPYNSAMMPPSCAAAKPDRIDAASGEAPASLPFPRDELLKLP